MPKKDASLGKSLIRAHKKKSNFTVKDGYRHTSDLPDGRDFGRLNLNSVTEQTSLDDFLAKAALAESDYISELSDIKIIDEVSNGILTESEKSLIAAAQDKNKNILCIPRRPQWDSDTSKEMLDAMERESFLTWRRELALKTEKEEHVKLTPYEKNLEVWRQLWRVVERSDVVVQIVDARNPLLFRCLDVEKYVKEIDKRKINVLLLNKADFLTEHQRKCWCDYFDKAGVRIAFFSALEQINRSPENEDYSESQEDNFVENKESTRIKNSPNISSESQEDNFVENKESTYIKNSPNVVSESQEDNFVENKESTNIKNSPDILSRENLISFLKNMASIGLNEDDSESQKNNFVENEKSIKNMASIGLVGYPNVGKSSTINAILMNKKVSVSATPGKTKHFQTHIIEKDLCLCDCPGLVFPNFISTKAEMIINGILPIDQLTDWVQPVSSITKLIPKHILESTYSILISTPGEGRDPNSPTAEEFLNAHGYSRGFMAQRGLPDNARSARYILKDFVNGKLLYCVAPPGMEQVDYHHFPDPKPKKVVSAVNDENQSAENGTTLTEADKRFFTKSYGVHIKGKGVMKPPDFQSTDKPWKKQKKEKKVKTRKKYYKNPYEE